MAARQVRFPERQTLKERFVCRKCFLSAHKINTFRGEKEAWLAAEEEVML